MSDFIKIGDRVDLTKYPEGHIRKTYVSQVLDSYQKNKIKIAMPIENGKLMLLETGKKYRLCFYTERGLYQCKGIVLKRFREQNIFVLLIYVISDLEKYQRRQYYRLHYRLKFRYRVISDEEIFYREKLAEDIFIDENEKKRCEEICKEMEEKSEWYLGMMMDISGGGIRFHSKKYHAKNIKILMEIILPDSSKNKKYEIMSNVITCEKVRKYFGFYESRVKFLNINTEQRENIIQFIFQEERKIRRKESGF